MACINMFNHDHQGLCAPPMSPRISFSNDFVIDSSGPSGVKHERAVQGPSSSDFEFSAGNYKMMAADELFFKGRLMPLKENCTTQMHRMTLRDELLSHHDDGDDASPRPMKGSSRWKELLGLKKAPCAVVKKHDKGDGSVEEAANVSKSMQELRSNGSAQIRNVEIGI